MTKTVDIEYKKRGWILKVLPPLFLFLGPVAGVFQEEGGTVNDADHAGDLSIAASLVYT
jgi:hypothetical protein